jgi:DNA-binding MarR family transcriptional regulator
MNYKFIRDLIDLSEQFEIANQGLPIASDINGFKQWICQESVETKPIRIEPDWDGKQNGRTPESVISTLVVHMNRYAKTYSKSAIYDSAFSTQEEFIYLITLKAYGEMTKMELIRRNIQEKPAGMLIVNRLLRQGWVKQANSAVDKRSKVLKLTPLGTSALGQIKARIDTATRLVCGDLSRNEKLELIRLLQKLERFHQGIYQKNIDRSELLDQVATAIPSNKN